MRSIKTVQISGWRGKAAAYLYVFGLLASFVTTIGFAPQVNAEPSDSSDLFAYCQAYVGNHAPKAKAGCNGEDDQNGLFTQARTVATYHCEDYESQASIDDGSRAKCIEQKAESYVKQVADDNPSSASEFQSKLLSKLKAANGSLTVPKSIGHSGAKSATTTGGSSSDCDSKQKLCPDIQDGVDCSQVACSDTAAGKNANCGDDDTNGYGCDLVGKYVNPTINLLSAIFMLIAIASVIMGGIQYAASEGDPQKVTNAKRRIRGTLLAVVAYFFLYSFLQFIVPGGIFKGS